MFTVRAGLVASLPLVLGAPALGQSLSCGGDGAAGAIAGAEVDSWTFALAAPGWIDLALGVTGAPDPGFAPWLELRDPDDVVVGLMGAGAVDFFCASLGTYTVLVGDDDAADAGEYALSLQGLTAELSCGGPLACGEDAVTGSLDASGDTDAFAIELAAPGRIDVAVGTVSALDPGFCATAYLYDPDGAFLGGVGCSDAVDFPCAQAGTYTLLVCDGAVAKRGTYTLSVQGLSDALSCGTPLACGEDGVTGSLDASGDTDAFAIEVGAPGRLDVAVGTASALDPGFCPSAYLYAPDGTLIGGGGCAGAADYPCAVAGTYTLLVCDGAVANRGSYTLSVQGVSDALACGATLRCERERTGTLASPADTDAFEFVLAAGRNVWLEAAATGAPAPGFLPCASLYGPAGEYLGAACGSGWFACPTAGAYTVLVHDAAYSAAGAYRLFLDECRSAFRRR